MDKKSVPSKKQSSGRREQLFFSIALFVCLFASLHLCKPSAVYSRDGSFREFGVGYSKKTLCSIWVVSILTAIACYVAVHVVLSHRLS